MKIIIRISPGGTERGRQMKILRGLLCELRAFAFRSFQQQRSMISHNRSQLGDEDSWTN